MKSYHLFVVVVLTVLYHLGTCVNSDLKAPASFLVRFYTTIDPNTPITLNVTREYSPRGVDHFYTLLQSNVQYYNENGLFRVVPNFVVQFGISGDPHISQKYYNETILDDPVKISNLRGTVAYAMTSDPNSRTTQLYVNFQDNSRLDKYGFTPFAVISENDMKIFDKVNAQYGEEPDQESIYNEGNAYLKKNFPKLDYIIRAEIVVKNN
jgi:peptidyl-prolyl cis-trans isomerase A (cyclophilin A)